MAIDQKERRLAELILYISQKSADDPNFGQTKLNKILFFADFSAYGRWKETITGAEYQHLPEGPAVCRMLPIQRELKNEDALAIQITDYWGFNQKRPINLREPDLSDFSGKHIALIDLWIDRLRPMTASEVSRFSHETAAWRATVDRETIHPKMALLGWGEPSAAEVRRGQEIALEHGLMA